MRAFTRQTILGTILGIASGALPACSSADLGLRASDGPQGRQASALSSAMELLPEGGTRQPRPNGPASLDALDYPATLVGTIGKVTVHYDPSLGAQGLSLARELLAVSARSYGNMEKYFAISGGAVDAVIVPLSGRNDGSGGAYHYGCDFTSGGVLYLDASFASKTVDPLNMEVGLFIAELSEAFMGPQGVGWGCGSSNGEGLSRYLAELETAPHTLDAYATSPAWANAGFPDWVASTEGTDRDGVSTGASVAYIYWMRSQGFSVSQIVQAGGTTLAANYQALTHKTTAYADLVAALKSRSVTADNPFGLQRTDMTAVVQVNDPDDDVDLNGDGKADVCGRGGGGILCGLSTGSAFGAITAWSTNYNDANGWNTGPEYWATIRFADINGDGKTDVCGRGGSGILCALSSGSAFGTPTWWTTEFSDANGWSGSPAYWSTIRLADINGDGKADVCGRGAFGIRCALSTGSSFGAPTWWSTNYTDAFGWNRGAEYWATIRFVDINGDGKADVCGRGGGGIFCGLSTGSAFGAITAWSTNYSDAFGWSGGPEYWSTIRFVDINGDGKADVCGRGGAGILCGLSTGSAFGSITGWSTNPSDANGWNGGPQYWSTIRFVDINGDGKADLCGRGGAGIWCGLSFGTGFGSSTLWSGNPSDANGWDTGPQYYGTLRLPDVNGDGKADVCGRGGGGILCSESSGSAFGATTPWSTNYSDAFGWNTGPQYYSTIRL